MNTIITISEYQFDAAYPLSRNHLNPQASWTIGNERGCLFETYGAELDFVRSQDPRTVWTLLDGDNGDMVLVSGFHYVNRIGYLISTRPVDDNQTIECRIPMNLADE